MSKMNKMNLFCIKCKNVTDDRTSIEIKIMQIQSICFIVFVLVVVIKN